jgi:hypothetical protein
MVPPSKEFSSIITPNMFEALPVPSKFSRNKAQVMSNSNYSKLDGKATLRSDSKA